MKKDGHHVVQSGVRYQETIDAQNLLATYFIDIQDTVNGLCLDRIMHQTRGLHKRSTAAEILKRLVEAERDGIKKGDPQKALADELINIANGIRNKIFP